ncbi:TetR/AcrR family transcriptional regulator [Mycobacterium sp. HM-7]
MNPVVNYQELERTHILCTARELVDHSGWQVVQLEDVLRHAGVCDRSFRRHFSCLDSLFSELLADELRSAARQLRHAAMPGKRPIERVLSYTATMIDYAYPVERRGRASALATIWLERSGHHVDQNDALVDELIEPLREAIHAGCRTGEMSSQCPDDDSQSIFHLVTGVILTQAALGRYAVPEHLKEATMDAVAHALGFTEQ